jgi:hypothetical protein
MFLISLLYIIYEDGPKTGARSFLNCQKLQKNGGQKGPKPQKKKTQALSSNQHKNQVNGAKTLKPSLPKKFSIWNNIQKWFTTVLRGIKPTVHGLS